ncbi:MAG: glycosyltransferase [Defluviitaleaceae bacterium]|nr:glycosyltransferase [Defluviitaleaceae bacterium]
MQKLVSVIIPVFNTAEYLHRCVDSILSQTYPSVEIILIDDGSFDDSPQICDAYADSRQNVQALHIENGGQGRARNLGIEMARGAYLMFCDSDDAYEPDMIEHLYNAVENHPECSIACCGLKFIFERSERLFLVFDEPFVTDKNRLLEMYFTENKIIPSPVNKIYKRQVFDSLRYPEGMIYEDRFISLEMFLQNPAIYFSGQVKYNYYIRKNSTIQSAFSQKNMDFLKVCENEILLVTEHAPDFLFKAQLGYLDVIAELLMRIIICGYRKNKASYCELLQLLKRKYAEYKPALPRKKHFKYRKFNTFKRSTLFYYSSYFFLRRKVGRALRRFRKKQKNFGVLS